MAAALAAAEVGCPVTVLDSGARPGGQYHRAAYDGPLSPPAAQLSGHSGITVRSGTTVWAASYRRLFLRTGDGPAEVLAARAVILATGAYDRPLPFPGWDLPGVFTVGGLQALWKGQRVRAGQRVALSGTGPFLLPVAAALAEAGVEVVGVYEANQPAAWARRVGAVGTAPGKVGEA